MFKKLLLLAAMALPAVATAQEYGNPCAYVTNDKGGALVLTDKEDKTICPPKAKLVVSVNSREETEPTLGCWVQMRNETTGQVEVRCEFCGQEYRFPLAEFGVLFATEPASQPAPERLQ